MTSDKGVDIETLMGATLAKEGDVGGAALPFAPREPERRVPSPPPQAYAQGPSGLPFTGASIASRAPAVTMPSPGPSALAAIHASAAGIPAPARMQLARDPVVAVHGPHNAYAASNGAIVGQAYATEPRGAETRTRDRAREPSVRLELVWVDRERFVHPPAPTDAQADIVDEWITPQEGDDHEAKSSLRSLSHGAPVAGRDLSDRHSVALEAGSSRLAVLVDGEIELRFDAGRATKALVALTAQLATVDTRMKAAHEAASAPGAETVPSLAILHEQRLRDALSQQSRETRVFVETHTERALLEGRAFETKSLFGGRYVVASFFPADGSGRIPVYLPEAAAGELPLIRRFSVRAVADVRARQDSAEAAPLALRLLALGRVIS